MRPPASGVAGGVLLKVRVTPKSSRDMLSGLVWRGEETRLAIKVRAAPQDGAANEAVCRAIATWLDVKPSFVGIAAGHKDRDKTILISGADLVNVQARLDGLGRHGETD
jgi:hypothetical protein